ncbi:hypothetical protein [uncultured Gilliamella sp.]|uniref:hypothetical protein n=1 Tax=uncultured Gilliamella sp. TaxID=1193505 RepID=UPI0025EC8289|nr:hypothetical protein [uncultured Gilliamella sp.]
MTTKIKICSDAALLVGCAPIADFSDDNTQARLVYNLFEDVKDSLLRSHPWNFAIKRTKLSPLADVPAYGYKYKFNTPSDLIRLLSIDSPAIGLDFKLEGSHILTNINSLNLRYVFRNDDISTWPSDFISAVKYELASQIAFPITKSDSIKQSLEQKAQYKLTIAKLANSLENPSQRLVSNPLLYARY